MTDEPTRETRSPMTFGDERIELCVTDLDQCELGGNKKAIQQHQHPHGQALQQNVAEIRIHSSESHLAEDHPENILQAHNPQLRAVAGQNDGQALAGALELAQGLLETHLVVKVKRRLEEI